MRPFNKRFRHRHRSHHRKDRKKRFCSECASRVCTLADVPPGCRARVAGFSGKLRMGRSVHLQAYGLMPGHWVRVIQHSPVMVVQVDHTELALEREMALEVNVDEVVEI